MSISLCLKSNLNQLPSCFLHPFRLLEDVVPAQYPRPSIPGERGDEQTKEAKRTFN